jgi:flagellar biosynthesis/type III secretory pathway protein FliH
MSPERMALPRGVVAFRALPGSAPAGPAAATPSGCVPLPALALKEVQRRAFERGREVERERAAEEIAHLLAKVEEAVAALDAMRAAERAECARFAVEVATAVAAELVGAAAASGAHDVARGAEAMLEEALPGLGGGPIELAAHPADLDALSEWAGRKAPPATTGRLRLVPDPDLPRGSCRLRAGGAEILADPRLRLATIAGRLRALAEAAPVDA